MRAFVDRLAELETLRREYERDEASFVVVYGRRRVGKTTLLVEFLKEKRSLYFLSTEESEAQNRAAFKNLVADFTDDTLLRNASVERWDDLFDRLTQGNSERLVIVIDEFQYLGKANAAFPSIFQRIWDTVLSKRNVMVVLCGSLISLMLAQTLSYESPLYGRRTAQIRMGQIPFSYYGEFFDDLSKRDLVERYSVTGGVPKYIELFKDKADVLDAIQANVLNRNSFLYDEANFLLQKEVGEVGTYFSLIKAIAAGNRKLGAMASVLEVKQTSLSKYLKTLVDLDILEREVPATELRPEKSKKGLYRIKDNYLLFWFRYVFPNLGLLESGHSDVVMSRIRANFIDGHVGYVYESVCCEKVWEAAAKGRWPFTPAKVGRWWGIRDVEIDLVAVDASGEGIVFGECKFWKGPVGVNVLRDLERKAAVVPHKAEQIGYALFSIEGFTDELRSLAAGRADVLLME
ncbi:MAG: ATP-binding protein [Gordonibacter sp.]|uniref:ATP-binding protein n=1 Tax=Gordonibacter sp. TaxID=1968902 RepID=UPI002FCCB0FC